MGVTKLAFLHKKMQNRPTSKVAEEIALHMSKGRILFMMLAISITYLALMLRMFDLSLSNHEDVKIAKRDFDGTELVMQRSNVVDRNGVILAVNLSTASLYAHPNKIVDKTDAIKNICAIFSQHNCNEFESKINSDKPFVWLKRHLTPIEQQYIHDLGIAGIGFMRDEKRVYPHGNLFAHTLGLVDIDSNGIAGVERFFDERLKNNHIPLQLSLDIRVQEILREELLEQAQLHSAIGSSGLVMDINTGEIIAMVSLPDFDPHDIGSASERARFNQVTLGVYEMGSTFKMLTLAMGLDGKYFKLNDAINTDNVIKVGNKAINDYRGKGGLMALPEVLMYSSNKGAAQIGMRIGAQQQRSYFEDFGLLSQLKVEVGEKSSPLYPSSKIWSQASTITISDGHGTAVTPMHAAKAISSVVNGGYSIEPTLLRKKDDEDLPDRKQILSSETSDTMRRMLRLVVTDGFGKKADASGYFVGGKTGTAEKIVGRSYSKSANLASFLGAFPMHNPKYIVLVIIDEALPNKINAGFTTGGMVAAPVANKIVSRIAPILGVKPRSDDDLEIKQKVHLDYRPLNKATLDKIRN
ncbi:MAG: penicillin-binding protein 2 [Candidatus Jidaibacter sp.]|jgi:cell division protein FtsI (penicillin-binding protein 3)|nr:penicillin-binding protein 2 [Candidatus Jidaibacter sp.]